MGRPIPRNSTEDGCALPNLVEEESSDDEETQAPLEDSEHSDGWEEGSGQDEEQWEDPSGGVLTEILNAAGSGDSEVLSTLLLIARLGNVSVDAKGPDGDTALHLSSVYGHASCVQCLLEGGACADLRDDDSATPLHDAAAGGFLEVVELLYNAAPGTVNVADDDGDTPLHNAARGGHMDVAQFLLSKGADPVAVNRSFERAVDLAEAGTPLKQLLQRACPRPAAGPSASAQ